MQRISRTNEYEIRGAQCDGACVRAHIMDKTQLGNMVSKNTDRAIGSKDNRDALTGTEEQRSNVTPKHLEDGKLTMNVGDAADWLGISRAFAYELVARGELPSIRLGRRVLIPTKRLYDFVVEDER